MARDDAKAAQLYQKGCDKGYPAGCYHLGVAHSKGIGVDRDAAKAAQLFGKACNAGHPASCTEVRALGKGTGAAAEAEPEAKKSDQSGAPAKPRE